MKRFASVAVAAAVAAVCAPAAQATVAWPTAGSAIFTCPMEQRAFAGTGQPGYSGDGGPATAAQLMEPGPLATMADGSVLIGEGSGHKVRRVSPDGRISTVAGTGDPGYSGDGGLATAATMGAVADLAVLPGGGFLIADPSNNVIRRMSPSGIISTVAGTGAGGFSGDGGQARSAKLAFPHGVAVMPDGGFLIADTGNHRIRRVSPSGTITTIAGVGIREFSGDNGQAIDAAFNFPSEVEITVDDNIYVVDAGNHVVRRIFPPDSVLPAGTIDTVAGQEPAELDAPGGFNGDHLATHTALNLPTDLALLPDGGFLLADRFNNRARRFYSSDNGHNIPDTYGLIKTFMGPDSSAPLIQPGGIGRLANGGHLVSDSANDRVLRYVPSCIK